MWLARPSTSASSAVFARPSAAGRQAGMSMEHSPGGTGPPPRRGPSVDLDPTGIVTGKGPDRQRRQFLNYSFYRLDPMFRRVPADERRAAGTAVLVPVAEEARF